MILGLLGVWAYPFGVATLPAPSALTAGPFCLGKRNQNRLLLHPALRFGALQGHRGLRLASPSLRLANFGFGRRVLRTSPLQTPTLSLLKSQSYGWRLDGRIFETNYWRSQADPDLDLDLDLHTRKFRRRGLRLQEAEWRCL